MSSSLRGTSLLDAIRRTYPNPTIGTGIKHNKVPWEETP
jgi:hypothetical protein